VSFFLRFLEVGSVEGAVGGGIASASVSGSDMLVEVAVDGAFDVGFMRWEAAGVCGRLGAIGAVERCETEHELKNSTQRSCHRSVV